MYAPTSFVRASTVTGEITRKFNLYFTKRQGAALPAVNRPVGTHDDINIHSFELIMRPDEANIVSCTTFMYN